MKSVVLYTLDSNGKPVPYAQVTATPTINATGDTINPSTEEKQDTMITKLDDIIVNTANQVFSVVGNDVIEINDVIDAPAASSELFVNLGLDGYGLGKLYISADQPIDVYVQVSFDGSVTWKDLDTPFILNADFDITKVNTLILSGLLSFRIKFVTGATAPTKIDYKFVKKVV